MRQVRLIDEQGTQVGVVDTREALRLAKEREYDLVLVSPNAVPPVARLLDYGPPMKAAEYRALNPMGKVPTVVHDGKVVTENAAICAYLAMAFPQAGLMAEDKAAFFRWLFFAAGPLEQAVVNTSFGWLTKDQHEKRRAGTSRRTTMSPTGASRQRMSMSARRWAGGCSSARSRPMTRSRPTGTA